jgi:hypothetical protein
MKKSFLCLSAAVLLISFSAGCIGSNTSGRDPWRNIKADELIGRQELKDKYMTVGLNVYVFHIQADKLTELQELIAQTDTISVEYSDPDAFLANGLTSCAGDRTSWQKIGQLLSQSQPQIKKRIGLLAAENMTDDVVISETSQPVSVVYLSEGTTTGIGFGAGRIVLRIKVTPLIGLRQICRLDITPVYKIGSEQKIKNQPIDRKSYGFVFDSAALNVRFQPGQFLLIAPALTETQQTDTQTVGNAMFYPKGPENTAGLCIIACSLINNPP